MNARNRSSFNSPEWTLIEELILKSVEPDGLRTMLLYGPPGTGKSLGTALAFERLGRTVNSITLDEDTSVQEYRGIPLIHNGKMNWRLGGVSGPASDGHVLIVNEINRAEGAVLSMFYSILDDPRIAQIVLDNEHRLPVRDSFVSVATMNGNPWGDLPDALVDRFEVKIEVNAPHPDAIMSLPYDLRIAAWNSATERNPERRIGLREWRNFAKLRKNLGDAMHAAQAVFGHRATEILQALEIAAA